MYAQKLDLGWVIIGDVCLGSSHRPPEVTSFKTHVLENGRTSYFPPCENPIKVREKLCPSSQGQSDSFPPNSKCYKSNHEYLSEMVFQKTKDDSKLAPSVEDFLFFQIMEKEFFQDSSNSWVAPLPFRQPRKHLPNNWQYAINRLKSLQHTLNKKPQMKVQLSRLHAENIG